MTTDEYRRYYEDVAPAANGKPGEPTAKPTTERLTVGRLIDSYPTLHEPLIDGLIRRGETANIISLTKIGKSWLAYGLILSFVCRLLWLGRFATAGGRVLLIDNELHRATLANRIRAVAQAMGIAPEEYRDAVEVLPIRGQCKSIYDLRDEFDSIRKGEFGLIILDAKYRLLPPDTSENDNAAETRLYGELDRVAESTGAAIINVHHTSKGLQADKRVTDVGAGAGAQSRAADAHLVLREHEEDDRVVLAAAVRSFAPVEPVGLRWSFPLWVPDGSIDTAKLKGTKSRAAAEQDQRDSEADDLVLVNCRDWCSLSQIHRRTGISHPRLTRAAVRLLEKGILERKNERRRGQDCDIYRLVTSDLSRG